MNRSRPFGVRNFGVGLILGLALVVLGVAGTLISPFQSLGTIPALAQTEPDPLVGQGVVYALKDGSWREALIRMREFRPEEPQGNWYYLLEFLDQGELEAHVTPDRIQTISQAQAQGLTSNVYDLSSQVGIDQMLTLHNQLRRQVGVAPLTWSDRLAGSAQQWADTLLETGQFQHSPNRRRRRGTIGENLHQRQGKPGWSYATPSRAVAGWINEGTSYTYRTNTCAAGKECGHYLQMVWSNTRQVGCAVARATDAHREVWACHYYPGGNVVGHRPY